MVTAHTAISLERQLHRLFETLRTEGGIPLGIPEYLDVLKALQSGFGMEDMESLRRLCLLLWANSKEEIWKVNHHFDRILLHALGALEIPSAQPVDQEKKSSESPEKLSSATELEKEKEGITPPASNPAEQQAAARAAAQAQQAQLQAQQRKRYLLNTRHTHLSDRQIAQAWRKLRMCARTGPKTELDMHATIQEVARTGYFLRSVLQNRLENAADVHFLMDRDGSMVPFHTFAKMLLRGASTVGKLPKVVTRYFHDFPQQQVYTGEMLSDPMDLDQYLQCLDRKHSLVVILSDAGAARGNLDARRIQATQEFLALLQRHCKRLVWLNPMPRHRWEGSSAAKIAQFVPMFETTAEGMNLAVDHLRGKIAKG